MVIIKVAVIHLQCNQIDSEVLASGHSCSWLIADAGLEQGDEQLEFMFNGDADEV